MSGMWKRSHGRTSKAPPDERGGYRYVRPTATAPHLDSTIFPIAARGRHAPSVTGATVPPATTLDFCSAHQSGGKSACPAQNGYLGASGERQANATDQRGRFRVRCRSLGGRAIP